MAIWCALGSIYKLNLVCITSVMSEVVEAMTPRTIAGISCLNLLQILAKLVPSVMLRGEGRGMSELNITMALNSVWRCSLI